MLDRHGLRAEFWGMFGLLGVGRSALRMLGFFSMGRVGAGRGSLVMLGFPILFTCRGGLWLRSERWDMLGWVDTLEMLGSFLLFTCWGGFGCVRNGGICWGGLGCIATHCDVGVSPFPIRWGMLRLLGYVGNVGVVFLFLCVGADWRVFGMSGLCAFRCAGMA